jgi:hypothetical protein
MSLTDRTYYKNEINLPESKYDDLPDFITRFEKEFCEKVFGYGLAKLILAYDVAHPDNSEQRIRDIVEGKEFTEGAYTFKWNGLINDDKKSPIAYYVYCEYLRTKITHTSTSGEVANKVEASNPAETNMKIQYAWQQMSDLLGNVTASLSYQEYNNSLMNFMRKYYNDYPDWVFNCELGNVNAFDL